MARIPDVQDLGARPGFSPSTSVARYDIAPPGPDALSGLLAGTNEFLKVVQAKDDVAQIENARKQLNDWEAQNVTDPEKGAVTLKGSSAFGVTKKLGEDYDAFTSKISDGLNSPRQRELFSNLAQSRRESITGWASKHELQQRETYYNDTYASGIDASRQRMMLNPTDPKVLVAEENYQAQSTLANSARQGLDKTSADVAVAKVKGDTAKAVISSLIANNDWSNASNYFEASKDKLDANSLIEIGAKLREGRSKQDAFVFKNDLFSQYGPNVKPTPLESTDSVRMALESGGRQFDESGAPLASSAGAIGRNQLKEEAARDAAKMAGVKFDPELFYAKRTGDPAQDKSIADYNDLLGKAYFESKVKEFGGDVTKAFAAYHDGSAGLKKAIDAATKAGNPENYIDYLSDEGKTYVNKAIEMLSRPSGPPVQRMDLKQMLAAADQQFANDPYARQEAHQAIKDQFNTEITSREIADKQATTAAYDALMQNGGNFSQLPASVMDAIPATALKNVKDFASYVQNGAPGDSNSEVYYELDQLPPDQLAEVDLRQYFPYLSEGDRKAFSSKINQAKAGESSGLLTTKQVREAFVDEIMGGNYKKTPDNEVRANALRRRYDEAVISDREVTGKPVTSQRAQEIKSALMKDTVLSKHSLFGFSWGAKKPYDITIDDVPAQEQSEIRSWLDSKGRKATEQAVVETYLALLDKRSNTAQNAP